MDKDDPNAALFGADEPEEGIDADKQIYEKNGKRVDVIGHLVFEDLCQQIEDMNIPDEDSRLQAMYMLTAHSVLDLVMDSMGVDEGLEASFSIDMFLGVALVNKKYNVNLFKAFEKALAEVLPSNFPDEETYLRTLEEFKETWWDIPQPILDSRTPNDAIRMALDEFGLSE